MIFFIVLSEDDLVKLQLRDPAIIEKIYKEYKNKIFNYLVIKSSGNIHTAEELFSDTFHSAIKYAPSLKNTKNIQGWLMQIASRRFTDHLRNIYDTKSKIAHDLHVDKVIHNHEDITESMTEKDRIIMMKLALNNLKENYKKTLTLKYIENMSQQEIADTMSKSFFSVQSTLAKAKKALKKELKKLIKD